MSGIAIKNHNYSLIPKSQHSQVSFPNPNTPRSHSQIPTLPGLIPKSQHSQVSFPNPNTPRSHSQIPTLPGLIPKSQHSQVSFPNPNTPRSHSQIPTLPGLIPFPAGNSPGRGCASIAMTAMSLNSWGSGSRAEKLMTPTEGVRSGPTVEREAETV